jgi:ligand-binding SRPBCC domain-containing protein
MPIIELTTLVKSDIQTCFDLSRSIDFHQITTSKTKEKAIAGKIKGLIELGESVTWEATHFFVRQTLTSKITEMDTPKHFRDEQVSGAFKFIIHDHYFSLKEGIVEMLDVFNFEAPFGLLGKLISNLILKNYLKRFLIERNNLIKDFAESGKWNEILKN